jgi:hypothetical protein
MGLGRPVVATSVGPGTALRLKFFQVLVAHHDHEPGFARNTAFDGLGRGLKPLRKRVVNHL